MEDIFKVITKFPTTTKNFSNWLANVVGRDRTKYDKIVKSPNHVKITLILQYLSSFGIPVTEAIQYHCYAYDEKDFFKQAQYAIIKEFERIENKEELTYIPF